ncbi:Uncharacterised protein [Prevotella denticola]|uniref:Uncharacterized protein n=1 Tax=Prevotella denticola TaxID=28129 RepID=A0A379E692_9BACT|nr:Uncharacterised protein [Prevotella denticola]
MPKTASEGMERKKNAADDTVCQKPPTAKTYSPSPSDFLNSQESSINISFNK